MNKNSIKSETGIITNETETRPPLQSIELVLYQNDPITEHLLNALQQRQTEIGPDGKTFFERKNYNGKVNVIVIENGEDISDYPIGDIKRVVIATMPFLTHRDKRYTRNPLSTQAQKPHWIGENRGYDVLYLANEVEVDRMTEKMLRDFTNSILAETGISRELHFSSQWFDQYYRSPFGRRFTDFTGIEYVIQPGMNFMVNPGGHTIYRINQMIERVIAQHERLQIVIPTCPHDEYIWDPSSNSIKFVDGTELGTNIPWTAQNTLDGLRAILPLLHARGIPVDITFALGDFEAYDGALRGMPSIEAFNERTNKSGLLILQALQQIIKEEYNEDTTIEISPGRTPGSYDLRLIGTSNSSLTPIARYIGVTNLLVNGYETWKKLVEIGKKEYVSRSGEIGLVNARRRHESQRLPMIRDFWLPRKGLPVNNDTISQELANDAGTYIAMHNWIMQHWNENAITLTGDGTAVEGLACAYTGSANIRVQGGYEGGRE